MIFLTTSVSVTPNVDNVNVFFSDDPDDKMTYWDEKGEPLSYLFSRYVCF